MKLLKPLLISLGIITVPYKEMLKNYNPEEKLIDCSNKNIKLYYNSERIL